MRHWGGCQYDRTRYRSDRSEGGNWGDHKKLPPVLREGVEAWTEV